MKIVAHMIKEKNRLKKFVEINKYLFGYLSVFFAFQLIISPGSTLAIPCDPSLPNCGAGSPGGYKWTVPIFGTDQGDFSTWLSLIMNVLIALAVMVTFIRSLMAVYMFISSNGNAEELAKQKGALLKTISGLALVVLSYLILRTIDPRLVGINPTP